MLGIVLNSKKSNSLVPGYSFWYRPNGLVSGQTNSFGVADSSGNVSQLSELGGSNITATQSTAINQPSLIANRIGSAQRKAIRFSGSPQSMTINNAGGLTNNVSGATIYIVVKSNAAGTAQDAISFSTSSAAAARFSLRTTTTNVWRLAARGLDGDTLATLDGSASSNAAFTILCGVVDYINGAAYLYENGQLVNSSASFLGKRNTSATNSAFVGLANVGGANYFTGDEGDIVMYRKAHSSADVKTNMSVLNSFYRLY